MKYFALLAPLVLFVACGTSDRAGFITPMAGGAGGRGGSAGHTGHAGASTGGSGGDGGDAGGGALDAVAPTISITSPLAVTDPNKGAVVTGTPVVVKCNASAGSAPGATIDASTVKIEGFDAKGVSLGTVATASSQNALDAAEYFATFPLVSQPNGPISFKCSASDRSTPPNIATTTVNTFLDNGPTIIVASPLANSSFSLKSKTLFKFSVTPSPLSTKDNLAGVDLTAGKTTLTVDDQLIDLSSAQSASDPNSYSINVDLNNSLQFPKTPSGTVPVEITAWNARGTEEIYSYTFDIDGTPPTIKIVSPPTGKVVGGHVTLEFTVTDSESGIDPNSVTVHVGNLLVATYDPTPNSGWSYKSATGTFDFGFDSNSPLIGGAVQVHIEVGASDNATNVAAGATEDLYLDNKPPIVDLDPPIVQERRYSAPKYYCSDPFDPLGKSPNDLSTVGSAGLYRALVWDETNGVDNQDVLHLAGADTNSVFLYAQGNVATPLLVAKHNTNNICDDLATDGTLKPALENLSPLAPAGAAFYEASAPLPPGGVCIAGSETTAPLLLCNGNAPDLTRVIDHAVVGSTESVIYAIHGVAIAECTGQDWVLTDVGLQNGWVCIAALAKDQVGNLGISAPLRVCLNSTLPGKVPPACAMSSMTPPSCTDGCTPPPHFGASVLNLPK